MNGIMKFLAFALLLGVAISSSAQDAKSSKSAGFDISKAPVVTPKLGAFPYFSLIEGYTRTEAGGKDKDANKDADFDRYEFFDGTKLIPVEGKLTTIEAVGQGKSGLEICKNYESLVTGLGGVKVYEGTGRSVYQFRLMNADQRHRNPIAHGDQMGVYALRLPDKEIWVEAYVSSFSQKKDKYYLTVVETKPVEVKASLLAAEEMKKELDAKGHVALYINFDTNKADIKPESQPTIEEIVKLLNNDPELNLKVEGHTDNAGEADYNKQLSEARAKSVVAALTAKGIEARRLKARGYG